MRNWVSSFVVAMAVGVSSTAPAAAPRAFDAVCSKIADGDTFTVTRSDKSEVRVRLRYADCPEVAHNKRQKDQPFGREAAQFIADELLGETVRVKPTGTSYQWIVADVSVRGRDVAELLVSSGYAQLDRRYKPPKRLIEAESTARKMNRGLWGADPPYVPPWEWRKHEREKSLLKR
jgi:endonuclease YncB( thermonuclease family)